VSCNGSVSRFAVGADASVVALPSLTGTGNAYGAAVATDGDIVVPEATANVVRVYEPAVSTSVPARTISGGAALLDFPTDTAIGPEGNIYVLNNGPTPSTRTVTVYPPTANGAVEPVRTITIPFVTDLFSLAVDDGGHVYVGGTGGIMVFAPGIAGGSSPIKHLYGPEANLANVISLGVNSSREVVVGEQGGMRVATFPPLMPLPPPPPTPPPPTTPPLTLPGAVRSLVVKGEKTDAKRKVVWRSPASPGDRPVDSYDVTVRKGSKVLFTDSVSTTHAVLKRARLANGKLKVTVRAHSPVGLGPPVTIVFRMAQPSAG
jgi:hypothetical protein